MDCLVGVASTLWNMAWCDAVVHLCIDVHESSFLSTVFCILACWKRRNVPPVCKMFTKYDEMRQDITE
jgi:hypothetical protein